MYKNHLSFSTIKCDKEFLLHQSHQILNFQFSMPMYAPPLHMGFSLLILLLSVFLKKK